MSGLAFEEINPSCFKFIKVDLTASEFQKVDFTDTVLPFSTVNDTNFINCKGLVESRIMTTRWGKKTSTAGVGKMESAISGMIFVQITGCRWRDGPEEYGPHKTLYTRWRTVEQERLVRWNISVIGVGDHEQEKETNAYGCNLLQGVPEGVQWGVPYARVGLH